MYRPLVLTPLLAFFLISPLPAQVTAFTLVKPPGAPGALLTLPGSVRRIALDCSSGCLASGAATWSVAGTTGGATATLTPSPTGNYADVTLGATGGTCPVAGTSTLTIAPTATVTVKATAANDPTKFDTEVLDVCSPAVEAYTIPFYRVLYSGQPEDVQGVIWGSANTDGTWQIMQQPSGGDATLDDARFHDTVFRATVKGLYKIRWTSAADNTKTSYSTFYVTGNTAPRLAQPNGTQPVDCTADPNTTGGVLEVGPSQQYKNLEAIAQTQMTPGVTIRLHNEDTTGSNPTTYHEWIQINGAGTHDNPIRLCGVPDSAGNLPVMDGQNATARADVLSPAYISGAAAVMVYNTNYDPYPAYNGPAYIVVEGLAMQHYSPSYNYLPAGASTGATAYQNVSAGMRFQNCRDCELNGSEVAGNGNGVFAESNDARAWGGVSERLLFEGNNVHDNGVTGDVHEHNWYLQAWFQVVQFNQMPTYNTSAQGSQFKDRGISWFRYNLVGTGAQRMLDLVEDQDAPNYLDPNMYLTNMRPSEPRDLYTGDELAAAQEAWHHSETVYGNIFKQGNSGTVHFFADNTGGYTARVGTLDFYNNTAQLAGSGSYRFSLFDTGDNNSGYLHYEWPTINSDNLVLAGWNDASSPYFAWNTQRDAFLNFGKVLLPTAWGTNVQNCTDNSVGACDGTGWPYQSNADVYFNGNAFNATGVGNFVGEGASSPFDATTFQLNSQVSGLPLTGSQAKLPVRFQYVPGGAYAVARSTVVNDLTGGVIGATDAIPQQGSTPIRSQPVATPVSISVAPATLSLAANASATLVCATQLSDGSSRACLSPVVTSSNPAAATVNGLVVTAGAASGTSVLSVTAEGLAKTVSVTITATATPTVVSIAINPTSLQLAPATTAKLTCTTTLSDNSTRACLNPVVTSSNPAVATVNGLVVTAGSAGGSSAITVAAEGQSSTANVTTTVNATPTVTSVAVSPSTLQLAPAASAKLTCLATLSDNSTRACLNPVVTSSNAAVATVNGLVVTAGTASGSTALTVKAEGMASAASVTVAKSMGPAVVSIAFNPPSIRLSTESTTELYCSATLSDGSSRACIAPGVTSSNNNVVTVSGLILKTGKQIKSALLTATAEGKTTTVKVTVTSH